MPDWLTLALVLLTARWWWTLGAALLDDLRAASEPAELPPELLDQAGGGRAPAFLAVARRRTAQGRWQGGFGRRSP